ncbi:hypothetical protein BASA62_000522 [Batrachochytrium salamandrivorans]|nr:hypothetical protein BASA62_000522 [Batrachochytrium salamandrivorans]
MKRPADAADDTPRSASAKGNIQAISSNASLAAALAASLPVASTPSVLNAKQRKKIKQQISIQGALETPLLPHDRKTASKSSLGNSTGPSGSATTTTGVLSVLPPRQLLVTDAIQARSFEIQALEKALSNATEFVGAQRVFQTIPRHMRRRAASHNIKRLPMNIRRRAMLQMEKDDKPQQIAKKRYKKRQAKSLREEFLTRPAHNTWLETHADHPNDKSLRSAFRSSKNQCVIHDASYIHPVQLKGPLYQMVNFLRQYLDPTFPDCAHKDYLTGSRHLITFFHESGAYPGGAVGLVQLLWNPSDESVHSVHTGERTVWIFIHPSIYEKILKLLQLGSTSPAFSATPISVTGLKGEFVRFEFCGPRSQAILSDCLQLCDDNSLSGDTHVASHNVWKKLKAGVSPTAFPPGVVLGLNVYDPRLSFPIKVKSRLDAPDTCLDDQSFLDFQSILQAWPAGLSKSAIWDNKLRNAVLESRVDNSTINTRRSKNILPGTRLIPLPTDSIIPALLIHRASYYSMQFSRGEYSDGWDLIVPRGWANEFWLTFIFAGARAAGLREMRSFHFESAIPSFPYDYPETSSYVLDAIITGTELEAIHSRTPTAKRPNFASLQVSSPFLPPFNQLQEEITGSSRKHTYVVSDVDPQPESLLPAEPIRLSDLNPTAAAPKSQNQPRKTAISAAPVVVLHSPIITRYIQRLAVSLSSYDEFSTAIVEKLLALSKKTGFCMSSTIPEQIRASFVRVVVVPLGKGALQERGILFSASNEDIIAWQAMTATGKCRLGDRYSTACADPAVDTHIDIIPSHDRILGYLTTGHFSLEHGRGQAIGCCSLSRLFGSIQQQKTVLTGSGALLSKNGSLRSLALYRGITGRICRPVILEIVS